MQTHTHTETVEDTDTAIAVATAKAFAMLAKAQFILFDLQPATGNWQRVWPPRLHFTLLRLSSSKYYFVSIQIQQQIQK